MLVPWMLVALRCRGENNPASVARLKAAAMQLLPPLLDGLNARRLSGSAQQLHPLHDTLVRAGTALRGAGAPVHAPGVSKAPHLEASMYGCCSVAITLAVPWRSKSEVHPFCDGC